MQKIKSWSALTLCGMLLASPFNSFGNPAAPAAPLSFTTLQPGGFRDIFQNLPINIVFVGYEQGAGAQQINQAALRSELPNTYRALARSHAFYGIRNFVGTSFNYDYNFVYAGKPFEDALFGYLSGIAQPQPQTIFQEGYNAQNANSLEVTQNHWIDAPSVEKWLADNADAMLGVNISQYTVFFINWHGRSDFKFHVYTKTDEPDTDTGVNHGLVDDGRKMIAWGGTTPDDEESGLGSLHRIWFYDLSAGPEFWSDNWNVDDADMNGDGVLDYRIAPVWEYGNLSGYRPFNNLSGDLGKVLRYVALDMLFTTSPLYKPAISAPRLPTNIELDVNLYQGDPAVNVRDYFNPTVLRQEVSELQPLNNFTIEVNDQNFSGRSSAVFDCFLTSTLPPYADNSCYGNRLGTAFGDLFLYNNDHLLSFLEGDGDYEIPLFIYNTTNERATDFGGYADDNWADGTQSLTFVFTNPHFRNFGLGPTEVAVHEIGHHLGLSHPHDGYDYETDNDFSQRGDTYFAWSGDESNTAMSYLNINYDFSQFDRDNMNRWLTAAYINQSNAILPKILEKPQAGQVADLLATADAHAAAAIVAYKNMDYLNASTFSKAAYQTVLNAAAQINVHIEPQASTADYRAKGRSSKFVDSIQDYRFQTP